MISFMPVIEKQEVSVCFRREREKAKDSRSQTSFIALMVASSFASMTSSTCTRTGSSQLSCARKSQEEGGKRTFWRMVGNVSDPVAVKRPSQIVLGGLMAGCQVLPVE